MPWFLARKYTFPSDFQRCFQRHGTDTDHGELSFCDYWKRSIMQSSKSQVETVGKTFRPRDFVLWLPPSLVADDFFGMTFLNPQWYRDRYIGIIISQHKDPVINQSGFHGMPCQGFEHFSFVFGGLPSLKLTAKAPENRPAHKRKKSFQPLYFSGASP